MEANVPVSFGKPLPKVTGRFLSGDALLKGAATSASVGVLLMLAALVTVLVLAAWPSIREFGVHFLTGSEWRPNELQGQPMKDALGHVMHDEDGEILRKTIPPAFGALPVIWGTVVSSLIALLVAVPVSFGAALVLVRMTWRKLSGPLSFLIEFLAAIPSIAYGLWGLFVLAPFLQDTVEPVLAKIMASVPGLGFMLTYKGQDGSVAEFSKTGRDMLCGGLILAIMILPIITAISRDVLRAVPRAQIEGTQALGANWWQASREMLKYSKSGLFGAVMLGLARAAGETMAITMVIGNNNQIAFSPFAPSQSMSSLLANEFAEANTPLHRSALMEVALVLLVMSLVFNIVARRLVVGRK